MAFTDLFMNLVKNMGVKKMSHQLRVDKNTYQLELAVEDPGIRVQYYLQDGLDKELLYIKD